MRMSREPSRFEPLVSGDAGIGGVYDLWRRAKALVRGERFKPQHGRESLIMAQFAWICAWLAIIPAVTAVWNLLLYRPPPMRGVKAAVSVLIPARNEADKIASAVNAVLANRDVDLEVVVLDDHSTDGTADIVRAIADPRVRVEPAPPLPPGLVGQAACLLASGPSGAASAAGLRRCRCASVARRAGPHGGFHGGAAQGRARQRLPASGNRDFSPNGS